MVSRRAAHTQATSAELCVPEPKKPVPDDGAAAGFHRNDAGRELRGQGHDGFALHATPQNDFARVIKPGDAAAALTLINAENRDIHA
jgi:hypothetical protein